jgi:hypothetical protein
VVLNVHAPTEDKIDEVKDSFNEELERALDKFPKYHMKILLLDFNAKVGREDIFKPTIGNESLHEISNDNGIRVVNFATSKNLRVKNTMFPHFNIYKYTWTSPDGITHNQIDNFLVDRRRHSSALDVPSFRAADCDADHYLVVAKVSERLAVNKQRSQRFHTERFNLKKLNEVEGKEKYRVNQLGDSIDTIEKNTETLINVTKEVGLEINVEKTKYMLLSRQQNASQNRDIKIANRWFENVSQFKYLGTTVTNQNLIQEEFKRRMSSGNACYNSVQSLLSSRLLSKKSKNENIQD